MSGINVPYLESSREKFFKDVSQNGKENKFSQKSESITRMIISLWICINIPQYAAHIVEQEEIMTADTPTSTSMATLLWSHPPNEKIQPERINLAHLAHLYGNASVIEGYINEASQSDLAFHKADGIEIKDCLDEYVNRKGAHGDRYCKTDRFFMIAQKQGFRAQYDYFDKVTWMMDGSTDYNYRVLDGGKIQVKSSGTYMVDALVTFITDKTASMKLIRERRDQKIEVVGGCSTQVGKCEEKVVYVLSCTAFQVLVVLEGELLYMDFGSFNVFKVSPEALRFTVLKLNENTYNK